MLSKLKTLFTTPPKDDAMTTATQPTTAARNTTEKVCSLPGNNEQLSATSGCDAEVCGRTALCENAVREKAYLLWEQAGYPDGDGQNFWFEAEQELLAEADAE